ncbi:MAG: porin family protein [Alphaproteobacteria bacterium]|nr:porin family protein [Alphaproteobacteria bacterium]
MKKLLLTASALVLGMAVAADAMADCNGLYIGVRAGATKHDYSKKDKMNMDELDSHVFMMSGALGYRYNYYRTELEYVWRDKDDWSIKDGGASSEVDFRTASIMWNHFVDFLPYNWWSPYVGAGIGFTKMKYHDKTTVSYDGETEVIDMVDGYNNTPTKFTWSVGGGLTLKVTNKFNVDAGYRYYDMGSIHKMDVKAHEFYGGLRYVF